METEVIRFHANDRIIDVAQTLREKKISGAPIVDDQLQVIGVVSEGDIMRMVEVHSPRINLILPAPLDLIELPLRMKHEFDEIAEDMERASSVLVGDIMTKHVITIHGDEDLADAAALMDNHKIKRLPVVDSKGRLIGIVTRGDIIGAMVRFNE